MSNRKNLNFVEYALKSSENQRFSPPKFKFLLQEIMKTEKYLNLKNIERRYRKWLDID